MDQLLAEKVIIVTGGGRGLGRAMTLGLAGAGATVIATAARERDEVVRVAEEARVLTQDDRVIPAVADVTSDGDCERIVADALTRFGKLDVLINNAGRGMRHVSETYMTEPPRFWEIPPSTWRLVVDTNVNGPFLMARAAVPHMLAARWGRIINVSTTYGSMRRAGFSPYGPSKAAVESETIIWAAQLEGTGITVNTLLPGGGSRTRMVPDNLPEAMSKKLLDPNLMVAPAIWLASERSNGVTGKRFVAARWRTDLDDMAAAAIAGDGAAWPPPP